MGDVVYSKTDGFWVGLSDVESFPVPTSFILTPNIWETRGFGITEREETWQIIKGQTIDAAITQQQQNSTKLSR
jgi:hypothetical protein